MTGSQTVFQQAMNQGHSAAWDQNWEEAANYYRQALDEFPEHPQALTNLGLALYELQEYEESLRYYQQAAGISTSDPIPFEKIAQLFERMGNLEQASQAALRSAEMYLKNRVVEKAVENWERVTRLSPENLQAHSRLAMVYERTGEKEKSVREYLASASLLQEAGERDKAVKAVTQAMQVIPNHKDAIQALTLLKDFRPLPKPQRPRGGTAPLRMAQVRQMEAGTTSISDPTESNLDPAALARQRALKMIADRLFEGVDEEPHSGPATQRRLQNLVTGTGLLRRPVDRTSMMLHLSQVVDLQSRGELGPAAEELEHAIEAGFEHPAASYDLGSMYYEIGRLESAVRHLQQALKHGDFALASHLLLGEIAFRKNQFQPAAIEYLEALKIADANMVATEHAADLRQLYEPMIEAQREQSDPQIHKQVSNNIRGLLMRPDWRSQMSKARAQLPKRDPKGPPVPLAEMITEARSSEVINSLSAIYELSQQGKYRSAMEEAFYTLQHSPTYLPLHAFMGEILVKQGELQSATTKFLVVAQAYNVRGELGQAANLYRQIINLAPMDMGARSKLIDLLKGSDQWDKAIAEYMSLGDVYYSLADLDMTRKTFTEALRLAQQSKVDRSWRAKILHRMADIDMQSLEWRQAMRVYEQIRTLQPDDEKARSGLVGLYLRLGQEPQALTELDNFLTYLTETNHMNNAAAFLERMVAEEGERIPIRRRLADLYKHLGQNAKAIEQLDAIGELLLQAGDRVSAIQTIEMILALNPPGREQYLQLLSEIRGG